MSGELMVEKKIKGRKRHIVVDTHGNLLSVVVHAANIHDSKGGIFAAKEAITNYPTIRGFCADAGYKGAFEKQLWDQFQLGVDIVERDKDSQWKVLSKRWIVERTIAWLNNYRVLSKDYEITKSSAEAMVKIAHSHTLLKRL